MGLGKAETIPDSKYADWDSAWHSLIHVRHKGCYIILLTAKISSKPKTVPMGSGETAPANDLSKGFIDRALFEAVQAGRLALLA
jgi:hypothetical protein